MRENHGYYVTDKVGYKERLENKEISNSHDCIDAMVRFVKE